jgi:CHAT domain-containing protein/tetratricopeptide (TPR) repeat protein
MSLYEQSLAYLRELGEKSSIAKCLNNLATIHGDRGDIYKAIEVHEESLALDRDLGDKSGIATNLANIASNYYDIADSEKALSFYEQSLVLFRELGDKVGIASNMAAIAGISSVRGDHSKALAMYEESLAVSRQAGDKRGMASTQNNMAIVHNNLGDLAKALKSYEESLALHRDVGDKQGIATSLANIASLFDDIGMQSKAFPARQEALRLFEQVGDTKGQAQVMGQIGDSLLSLGDAAGALSWFEKAFGLLGPDYGPVHALTELRIDEAKLALGTKFEELHAFKRLLFVTMAGQGGPLSWRFLLAFARAYPSGGLPMRYALACAERFGEPDAKASVYVAMANVAAKSGDKIIEMTHLQRAVDSLQSLRRGAVGLGEEHTGALRTRFTSDYRRLVGLLHDAGRPGQAQLVRDLLDNAEQGQLGNIADNKPTRRLSPSEQAYDKVAQELRDLGRRERILAKVKHPSPAVLSEIQGMPDRIKATNDRLLAAFDNVLADARRGSASAVDVSESLNRVKRMLKGQPPGTAAASVLCTPTGVRFVVWTSRGVAQRRSIVDEKILSAKVEAFREVLSNPSRDPVALARELYGWLWKPIQDLLVVSGARRVLLHLDGPARYVPFGALHDGKGYVAERWETSLFAPTLTEGMTDRPSRQWSVLAAGTTGARTVTDALGRTISFTALPGVRTEVSRVRRAVGAGPVPLLDGTFDANSLARGLASHPKVVHLASHFVFDAGGESLSFLLTGKGQVLPVSDTTVLTKEHLAGVELLTLSACQTGRFSQTRDGMEVEGIAGILRRKGVKAVMSTLWPVADTSTAAFMGTFYMLRAQDPRRTKAWCLREAQLRLIRGEVAPPGVPKVVATRGTTSIKVSTKGLRKDWSHPYHWAPFILQGNPL